jgi:hypothetical protein
MFQVDIRLKTLFEDFNIKGPFVHFWDESQKS